jgi:hypothetical protein
MQACGRAGSAPTSAVSDCVKKRTERAPLQPWRRTTSSVMAAAVCATVHCCRLNCTYPESAVLTSVTWACTDVLL